MPDAVVTPNPELAAKLLAQFPVAFGKQPAEVELITSLVFEQMAYGPKPTTTDPYARAAERFATIYPKIMQDERLEPMKARLFAEHEQRSTNEGPEPRKMAAVFLGLEIALVVDLIIIGYCLHGEPGC